MVQTLRRHFTSQTRHGPLVTPTQPTTIFPGIPPSPAPPQTIHKRIIIIIIIINPHREAQRRTRAPPLTRLAACFPTVGCATRVPPHEWPRPTAASRSIEAHPRPYTLVLLCQLGICTQRAVMAGAAEWENCDWAIESDATDEVKKNSVVIRRHTLKTLRRQKSAKDYVFNQKNNLSHKISSCFFIVDHHRKRKYDAKKGLTCCTDH